VRKSGLLQERREATLSEVRGVDQRSCAGGEDEVLIVVAGAGATVPSSLVVSPTTSRPPSEVRSPASPSRNMV